MLKLLRPMVQQVTAPVSLIELAPPGGVVAEVEGDSAEGHVGAEVGEHEERIPLDQRPQSTSQLNQRLEAVNSVAKLHRMRIPHRHQRQLNRRDFWVHHQRDLTRHRHSWPPHVDLDRAQNTRFRQSQHTAQRPGPGINHQLWRLQPGRGPRCFTFKQKSSDAA